MSIKVKTAKMKINNWNQLKKLKDELYENFKVFSKINSVPCKIKITIEKEFNIAHIQQISNRILMSQPPETKHE